MATSADLKKGQWCLAVGHPGGYQKGRPPVVRVGRILEANDRTLRTDCTLVGGDSGGPLFDMHGKVIGIHSRIGGSITYNIHVPVDTYRHTWDKLAASEVWGNSPFDLFGFGNDRAGQPYFGITGDTQGDLLRIQSVVPESPAEKAGLRADDVILRVDDRDMRTLDDLTRVLRRHRPGAQVRVEVRRGDQSLRMMVTLGKRPA
jgi:serine protease Do